MTQAGHLKTGTIEMRNCSVILDPLKEARVSMASFLVEDQTEIIGTVNASFANHNGFEAFNQFLAQIYKKPTNSAEELRRPIGYEL
ncbi:MAG: hypothetical protein M3Q79_03970 [bacterium]|nr:hypothetical protein [bacterium]